MSKPDLTEVVTREETFDINVIIHAIEGFLELGEKGFVSGGFDTRIHPGQHRGYFSGYGFAARALRYHLEQLKKDSK